MRHFFKSFKTSHLPITIPVKSIATGETPTAYRKRFTRLTP